MPQSWAGASANEAPSTRSPDPSPPSRPPWPDSCVTAFRAERLGFRPPTGGAGPRDATGRCAEASGGTRRDKIPGEYCTGLLARTSSRLRRANPPNNSPAARPDRTRGDKCFADWPQSSLAACTDGASLDRRAAEAAPKKDFKVGWSIYVGWMPWGYVADSRHREEMGRQIRHQRSRSRRSTTTSNASTSTPPATSTAAPMTNMDALTIPAGGGVDTTALIVGDFSNGNDGIILKDKASARRHQGPEGQPRRALGVALPAGAGARYGRS